MFRIQHQYLWGGELDIAHSLLFTQEQEGLPTLASCLPCATPWLLWFPSFLALFMSRVHPLPSYTSSLFLPLSVLSAVPCRIWTILSLPGPLATPSRLSHIGISLLCPAAGSTPVSILPCKSQGHCFQRRLLCTRIGDPPTPMVFPSALS